MDLNDGRDTVNMRSSAPMDVGETTMHGGDVSWFWNLPACKIDDGAMVDDNSRDTVFIHRGAQLGAGLRTVG